MSGQKNILITSGIVLSIGLIVAILSVAITSQYYSRQGFNQLNAICEEILEQEPEAQKIIPAALKEYTNGNIGTVAENDILSTLGYSASDFTDSASAMNILFVIISFLTGVFLFGITFLYRNKVETKRIQALANYLEQVNTGKAVILGTAGEDEFSKLEDEIYKTVTSLYQTKDTAIEAKNDFADNLANIAHQLKTPITAISLATQMMRENNDRSHLAQIEKQLVRLTHLEESLLVLSRLDAGTLLLQAAYDKAVEVVTDKVREQTQAEDIKILDDYQKSVTSPKSANSPQVKKIADQILSRAKEKLMEAAGKILQKVQSALMKPEARESGKEEIKQREKLSIHARMEQAKIDAERQNRERKQPQNEIVPGHKNNMEL